MRYFSNERSQKTWGAEQSGQDGRGVREQRKVGDKGRGKGKKRK